jgi:hypothetical protein
MSIKSIVKSPTPEKWTLALTNEIESLIQQKVFSLDPVNPENIPKALIIPSRVIFDIRMNADGSINKYKARLVAQGNHQDSTTFFQTFADTASAKSINILLSFAASENLDISSIDVKTAFLYSPLKEEIYLRRPSGISDNIMPAIVKLNKCIYGLRQAAHEWRQMLHNTLTSLGFLQFQTDNCVYKITLTINKRLQSLYLGVFVDDILCLGTTSAIIDWFHNKLSESYSITFNRTIDSFLGMQIHQNKENKIITLSQPGYIDLLLNKFHIDPTKSHEYPTTPMSSNDMLDPTPEPLSPTQQSLYMQIVGSLLFLSTRSRPDISFAVNYLTLFMTKATNHHLAIGYRILKYICKTKHLALSFSGQLGVNFYVTVDSSYASHKDRKSHYGYSIHMNESSGSCITSSKKSSILALSSTEAEYIGMFEASKIIMWLRQFLHELGYAPTAPTILFEDNKSAIHIAQNGNDKGRTKHMDVRYHYLRDLIHQKAISVQYMPTNLMTSDILTKPLDPKQFQNLRKSLLGT